MQKIEANARIYDIYSNYGERKQETCARFYVIFETKKRSDDIMDICFFVFKMLDAKDYFTK